MPATRTPEGFPTRCPLCGAEVFLDYSDTGGDAPCPGCGVLLIRSSQRAELLRSKLAAILGVRDQEKIDSMPLAELGGSLNWVELVMELEEDFDLDISEEELSGMETFGDLLRFLLKRPID